MQLIRILFFRYIVLLLESTIDCAYRNVYHILLVENIKSSETQFTNNKPFVLFNTDTLLSDRERWDMCNAASQIVNEEGGYILISKDLKPDLLRPYVVAMVPPDRDSKIVQAFKCPTKSPIYLQIDGTNGNSGALLISIIVCRRDIQLRGPRMNGMCIVQKLVREIRRIEKSPWLSNLKSLRRGAGWFDTNQLPDIQRIEMCREARMEMLVTDRNIKFVENTPTDAKRLYMVQSEKNSLLYSVVEAFGCPTIPVIYLEVLDIEDNGGTMVYWIRVIAETTPKSVASGSTTGLQYRYHLEIVLCVTTSTVRKLDNLADIPEEQRLSMCKEALFIAFQEIHQTDGQKFKFLKNPKPGNSQYYRVLFNGEGKREDAVLGFKCPTTPPVFLAVADNNEITSKRQVRIFVEEMEFVFPQLGIGGYRFEIVADVTEVALSKLRADKLLGINLHTSVIGPDLNFPEQCRKLCEQIVSYLQNDMKIDIEFLTESEIGPSRYYIMETAVSQKPANESTKWGLIAVKAFTCPTYPETYLNVRAVVGTGYIVWIYMTEMKRMLALKVLRFETAGIFITITAVSDPGPKKSVSVNTDLLDEERRRQLCRSALMHTVSKPSINYLENIGTEKLQFYALERETEDGRILRSFVQAFKCPTDPPIYLHIRDQDGGHVVWIIEKIAPPPPPSPPPHEEILPPLEFWRYNLKLVKEITEATSVAVGIQDISSHLDYMTLDTNTFPAQYCYFLCKKAAQIVSEEKVDVLLLDGKPGPSIFYHVLGFHKVNYESTIKAFQCPTDPPLYLQVMKESGIQSYSIVVLVKKSNLIDVRNEIQYIVKFVENITEGREWRSDTTVESPSSREFGLINSSAVDIGFFTKKQRLQMCKEALKQFFPADTYQSSLESMRGDTTPQKFYSLSLQSRDENLERHTVRAFQCPTVFEMYLELHYWQSQGFVAWIIARKIEVARLKTEFKKPQRQPPGPTGEPIIELSKRSKKPIVVEPPRDIRRPRNDAGSDPEIKSYKVKFVEDIYPATRPKINLTLSSPRARSMVNTDQQYSEDQRVQMCTHATKVIARDQNVRLLKGLTGRSKFFDINEGFEIDNIPEIKCVRVFECPTEPPLFLEVRYRKYKGTTVTVIMNELNTIKRSMSFTLKPVETIKRAKIANPNTSLHSRSSSNKSKKPTITNEFSASKMLQICKRAWKMVSDRELQLSVKDVVNVSKEYVIDSDSPYSEKVHAFKCPTKPPIYLEIHRRVPGEYTILIINEKCKANLILTAFSKKENIKYRMKPVTNISKALPYQIGEILKVMPHLEDTNMDDVFDEVDRTVICRDAMKMIPDPQLKYLRKAICDITGTYILNAESKSQEFVKAFKCPTAPEMYIQLEENEDRPGYIAWMIVTTVDPLAISSTRDQKAQ